MNKAKISNYLAWVMTLEVFIAIILFMTNTIPSMQGSFMGGVFMGFSLMIFGMTIMFAEYEDSLEKGITMTRLEH